MQVYLAVTPSEAQRAVRFRRPLAHVAYSIGESSTLLRQNLLLTTRGGVLSVTDYGAPPISRPDLLSAAAIRECGRRNYEGVLLDFESPPTPDREAFARELADEITVAATNAGDDPLFLTFDWPGDLATDALTGQQFLAVDGKITICLPPLDGVFLV